MRKRSVALFVLAPALLSLATLSLHAGELLHSYVNEDDDHYVMHLDMRIDADADDVYDVLMDFNNMMQVNNSIISSTLLESNDKIHTLRFVSDGCVWFYCREVKQLVTVTELGQGYILSETDPAESDLSYGKTLWQIIDEGDTTRIKYNSDYVPDFWVPPIFGSTLFQERMLEEGKKTVNGIERLSSPISNDE